MREIDEPISPIDIAAATHLKKGSVRHLLLKMAKDGLIEKANYGKYRLAGATV